MMYLVHAITKTGKRKKTKSSYYTDEDRKNDPSNTKSDYQSGKTAGNSKYQGGFIDGKNSPAYNHDYYIHNKDKWQKGNRTKTARAAGGLDDEYDGRTLTENRISMRNNNEAQRGGIYRPNGDPISNKPYILKPNSGKATLVKSEDNKYAGTVSFDYTERIDLGKRKADSLLKKYRNTRITK